MPEFTTEDYALGRIRVTLADHRAGDPAWIDEVVTISQADLLPRLTEMAKTCVQCQGALTVYNLSMKPSGPGGPTKEEMNNG